MIPLKLTELHVVAKSTVYQNSVTSTKVVVIIQHIFIRQGVNSIVTITRFRHSLSECPQVQHRRTVALYHADHVREIHVLLLVFFISRPGVPLVQPLPPQLDLGVPRTPAVLDVLLWREDVLRRTAGFGHSSQVQLVPVGTHNSSHFCH